MSSYVQLQSSNKIMQSIAKLQLPRKYPATDVFASWPETSLGVSRLWEPSPGPLFDQRDRGGFHHRWERWEERCLGLGSVLKEGYIEIPTAAISWMLMFVLSAFVESNFCLDFCWKLSFTQLTTSRPWCSTAHMHAAGPWDTHKATSLWIPIVPVCEPWSILKPIGNKLTYWNQANGLGIKLLTYCTNLYVISLSQCLSWPGSVWPLGPTSAPWADNRWLPSERLQLGCWRDLGIKSCWSNWVPGRCNAPWASLTCKQKK